MDRTFDVGDTVVIRSWEDMESEFGIDERSDCIPCKFQFVRDMEFLCGREYVVQYVYDDGDVDLVGFDEPFSISTDMIAHVDQASAKVPEVSADDLFGVLCE